MQEKSIIKKNILKFIDFKGISKYRFYKITGITRGILDQKNGMSEENTAIFLAHFPEVNSEWLLTGKGSMIKQSEPSAPVAADQLLVYTAYGSISEAYSDEIPIEDRVYVSVSGFTNTNHRAFRIVGNSMTPLAHERDIVIGKRITDPREITNGDVYVIAHQTDGVMCKRLYIYRKGDIFEIKCACDNELYEPRTYLADEFIDFWHVKAVLKYTLSKAEPDFIKLQKLERELDAIKKKIHKGAH